MRVGVILVGLLSVACLLLAAAPEPVLQGLGVRQELDGTRRYPGPRGIRWLRTGFGGMAGVLAVGAFALVLAPSRTGSLVERFARPVRRLWAAGSADVRSLRGDAGRSVLLATVVGAVVRAARLPRPIEFDEATTAIHFTSRTLLDAVSDYSVPNNHVFHSVLAHLSTALFGPGEVALRLPAWVTGVLLIPATAWLAARLGARQAAGPAAWLVALFPPLVIYAGLARGYPLGALLAVASMIVVTFDRPDLHRATTVVAGGLLGLALWSVPTLAMSVLAIGIFVVISSPWRTGLARGAALALVTSVTTLALYLPILATMGLDALIGHDAAGTGPGWANTLVEAQALTGLPPIGLGLVGLGLAVTTLLDLRRRRSPGALVVVATAAGALTFALFVSRNVPARAFIASAPLVIAGAAAMVGAGNGSTAARWTRRAVVGLGAVWLFTASRAYERGVAYDGRAPEGLHAAVRSLMPRAREGARLAVDVSEAFGDPARYYAMREGLSPFAVAFVLDPDQLRSLSEEAPAFLITRKPPHGPGANVEAFLRDVGIGRGVGRVVEMLASPSDDLDIFVVRP